MPHELDGVTFLLYLLYVLFLLYVLYQQLSYVWQQCHPRLTAVSCC